VGKWTFVLGGVRSGKSQFALDQAKAQQNGAQVTFLASAIPFDQEMKERVKQHQAERPAEWETIEAPYNVVQPLRQLSQNQGLILWDCVTVFVSNLMIEEMGPDDSKKLDPKKVEKKILGEIEQILALKKECRADMIVVSNEVGHGVVPESESGRFFRDIAGKVNQVIAAASDHVFLITAGIPLKIK